MLPRVYQFELWAIVSIWYFLPYKSDIFIWSNLILNSATYMEMTFLSKFFMHFLCKIQEVMLILLADKSKWTRLQDLFSEGHCFLLSAQHFNLFMLC